MYLEIGKIERDACIEIVDTSEGFTTEVDTVEIQLEQELESSQLANALVHASEMGVCLPIAKDSTPFDIASMVVDGFDNIYCYSIADFWAANLGV